MEIVGESVEKFESRKADHIRLALDGRNQATAVRGLTSIDLVHEAFPEIDFSDVDTSTLVLGHRVSAPMFVSSMTAGHSGSLNLNLILARACEEQGWAMGVGSQRRQLFDDSADQEWLSIRKQCKDVTFFGNIGLAQVIANRANEIQRLVDSLQARAMIVHTNPLQECLQPEGTPQFKGGLKALESLVKTLNVPVIVKETGCGISPATLNRLHATGVAAVDVSGLGGTHWGRIEGARSQTNSWQAEAAETFADWGISTVQAMLDARKLTLDYEIWASGGVRTGLDVAKLVALGARYIGFAKPMIEASLKGEAAVIDKMNLFEKELRIAMFCTGSKSIEELRNKRVRFASSTHEEL